MLPKRVRISKSATDYLKTLKGRTTLTPNIVCRMALLLSLERGAHGGSRQVTELGSELNSLTLFGEYGYVFEALIRQVHGVLDSKQCGSVVVSHIDDGLEQLRKSRSLLDMAKHAGFSIE